MEAMDLDPLELEAFVQDASSGFAFGSQETPRTPPRPAGRKRSQTWTIHRSREDEDSSCEPAEYLAEWLV